MSSSLTRSRRGRGRRSALGSATLPRRATPIRLISASASGSTMTYSFDQPVVLDGVPQFLTSVVGAMPISASRPTPQTIAITYDAPVSGAGWVSIGLEDPAVRNLSGGFVTPIRLEMP